MGQCCCPGRAKGPSEASDPAPADTTAADVVSADDVSVRVQDDGWSSSDESSPSTDGEGDDGAGPLWARREAPSQGDTGRRPEISGPVFINAWSKEELVRIRGIGQSSARRIIDARPIRSEAQLRAIPRVYRRGLKSILRLGVRYDGEAQGARVAGAGGEETKEEPLERRGADGGRFVIGSWNLRCFSDRHMAPEHVENMHVIAHICASFDAFALQEVRDVSACESLLRRLNDRVKRSHPGEGEVPQYHMAVSRKVGTGRYKERYAFFWRTDRFRAVSETAAMVRDPEDRLIREPFIITLQDSGSKFPPLMLINIHIIYGDRVGPRVLEARHMAELVERARRQFPETHVVVCGDFNMNARKIQRDIIQHHPGVRIINRACGPTTLGGRHYDWFLSTRPSLPGDAFPFVSPRTIFFEERVVSKGGAAGRTRPEDMKMQRLTEEQRRRVNRVSDHRPISFVFAPAAARIGRASTQRLEAIPSIRRLATRRAP